MNVVIGARGRIGRAIVASFGTREVLAPERAFYAEWWRRDGAERAARCLERYTQPGVLYVAAGIIDPARPSEEHERINYRLAANAIAGATRLGYRVITLGTVMENVVAQETKNPYYRSKLELGRFADEFSPTIGSVLHIRLNTVFGGGPPPAFSFLGQMLSALAARREFEMSPGTQLREYHHLEDEAEAIRQLAATDLSGAIDLSHGHPIRLRDLATYVFTDFGCAALLRIGARPAPNDDNYGLTFERPLALHGAVFRPALPAVAEYLKTWRHLPTGRAL